MKKNDDATDRLLQSKCNSPCDIMWVWLTKEIQDLVSAMELNNVMTEQYLDQEVWKDATIRK